MELCSYPDLEKMILGKLAYQSDGQDEVPGDGGKGGGFVSWTSEDR